MSKTNTNLPQDLYEAWWNLEYINGNEHDELWLRDTLWGWFTQTCNKLDKEFHPE